MIKAQNLELRIKNCINAKKFNDKQTPKVFASSLMSNIFATSVLSAGYYYNMELFSNPVLEGIKDFAIYGSVNSFSYYATYYLLARKDFDSGTEYFRHKILLFTVHNIVNKASLTYASSKQLLDSFTGLSDFQTSVIAGSLSSVIFPLLEAYSWEKKDFVLRIVKEEKKMHLDYLEEKFPNMFGLIEDLYNSAIVSSKYNMLYVSNKFDEVIRDIKYGINFSLGNMANYVENLINDNFKTMNDGRDFLSINRHI